METYAITLIVCGSVAAAVIVLCCLCNIGRNKKTKVSTTTRQTDHDLEIGKTSKTANGRVRAILAGAAATVVVNSSGSGGGGCVAGGGGGGGGSGCVTVTKKEESGASRPAATISRPGSDGGSDSGYSGGGGSGGGSHGGGCGSD
ncbi:hypothetical protein Tco_0622911 [Tanacetum coccineum]